MWEAIWRNSRMSLIVSEEMGKVDEWNIAQEGDWHENDEHENKLVNGEGIND